MDTSSILEESMVDGNGSRALRPSRRRVQKGSAVVLNADRLKKIVDNQMEYDNFAEESLDSDQHAQESSTPFGVSNGGEYGGSSSSSPEQMLQMIKSKPKVLRSPVEKMKGRPSLLSESNSNNSHTDNGLIENRVKLSPESEKMVRNLHKDMTASEAAKIICQWYKHKVSRRMERFTQYGKWKLGTAEKVHALILGHRVRNLFKFHPDIKRNISSQRDVQRVLQELVSQQAKNSNSTTKPPVFNLQKIMRNTQEGLHGADQQLAVSLIKELLADREKLKKCLFQQSVFVPFPKPGYWNIHVPTTPTSNVSTTGTPSIIGRAVTPNSAPRSMSSRKSLESTPQRPHSAHLFTSPARKDALFNTPSSGQSALRPLSQGTGQWQQETPPHVKKAIEQTVKVPVKLYVGKHHRSLIDESLQNATDLQAYLQEQQSAVSATADTLPEEEEDKDAKPSVEATNVSHWEDDRPIRGAGNVSSTAWDQEYPADDAPSNNRKHHSADMKRKSLKVHHQPAVSMSHNPSSSHHHTANAPHVVQRKRTQDGCHIQLEIISGEKLIPAKKGALTTNAIPDRKPSLKVTLLLPGNQAFGNVPQNTLKKVAHVVRDYEELTFYPVWNANMYFTLPFPKLLVKAIVDNAAQSVLFHHPASSSSVTNDDPLAIQFHELIQDILVEEKQRVDAEDPFLVDANLFQEPLHLSDREYEQMTRCLLHFWASGQVLIEVVDGERFNEDIFMGQTLLLLTSFLPNIRKLSELEIKGNFTLEKQRPTNRVSGSINVQAFWHAPEKAYMEEHLHPLLQENLKKYVQALQQQQQQQQQQIQRVGGMKMSAKTSQKLSQHHQHQHHQPVKDPGHRSSPNSEAEDAYVHQDDVLPQEDEMLERKVANLQDFMKYFDTKRDSTNVPGTHANHNESSSSSSSSHHSNNSLFASKFMQNLVHSLDKPHASPLANPILEESENIRLPIWSTPATSNNITHKPVTATAKTAATPSPNPVSLPTSHSSHTSANRRSMLANMSKQLDMLHAVQHSAEEAVDSYGKRLQEHMLARQDTSLSHIQPLGHPLPNHVTPKKTPVAATTTTTTSSSNHPSASSKLPASRNNSILRTPERVSRLPPADTSYSSNDNNNIHRKTPTDSKILFATPVSSKDKSTLHQETSDTPNSLPPPPPAHPAEDVSRDPASHHKLSTLSFPDLPYPTELKSPEDDDDGIDHLQLHQHQQQSHRPSHTSAMMMLSSPSAHRWEAEDTPMYTDLYDEDEEEDLGHGETHVTHVQQNHHNHHNHHNHSKSFYEDDEDDCLSHHDDTDDFEVIATQTAETQQHPPDAMPDISDLHDPDGYDDDDEYYKEDPGDEEEEEEEEEFIVIPSPVAPVSQSHATFNSVRSVPPPPPPPPRTPPRTANPHHSSNNSNNNTPHRLHATPQHATRLSNVLAQVDAALQEVQLLTAQSHFPPPPPAAAASHQHSHHPRATAAAAAAPAAAVSSPAAGLTSPSRIPKFSANGGHRVTKMSSSEALDLL